jgi:hypothetical protein
MWPAAGSHVILGIEMNKVRNPQQSTKDHQKLTKWNTSNITQAKMSILIRGFCKIPTDGLDAIPPGIARIFRFENKNTSISSKFIRTSVFKTVKQIDQNETPKQSWFYVKRSADNFGWFEPRGSNRVSTPLHRAQVHVVRSDLLPIQQRPGLDSNKGHLLCTLRESTPRVEYGFWRELGQLVLYDLCV